MSEKKENKSASRTTGCLVFVIILLLAALAGLGCAFYLHVHDEKILAAEERAYDCLKESTTSEDFRDFIRRYPTSRHIPEVVSRMENLQLMERVWAEIEKNGDADAYRRFARRFENTYYDKLASARTDSLDWMEAKKSDDPDSYDKYMRNHPDGSYFAEASLAHRKSLGQLPSAEQLQDVRTAIERFLSALAKGDGTTVGNLVTSVVGQFLGQQGVGASEVAKIVKNMLSEHIKNCTFKLSDDFEVKRLGTHRGYTVHAGVEQSIKRDNAGKTAASYVLDVTLDENMKISSVSMKETSRK